MAALSTTLMLRRIPTRALSQSYRVTPKSARDAHQVHPYPHWRRRFTVATSPLRAHPNKYVTGATLEQMAESQAMRDWYAANCKGWQKDPEKNIIGKEGDEENKEDEEDVEAAAEGAIVLPAHLSRRNIRPLVTYLREPGREEGSRQCYKLRNPGVNDPWLPLVPGILHGSDPFQNIVSVDRSSKILVKTPWFEIQRELDRYHYGITGSFVNRVYALTVFPGDEAHLDHHRTRQPKDTTTYHVDDDTNELIATPGSPRPTPPPRTPVEGMENILVIPADLQMHPVSHSTYCLNFIRYHPNKPIKIPIRTVNEEESPTLKRGGFLALVNRFIECLVEDGTPIPECIELECTGLKLKEVVRRGRLIVPEGVTIHPRVPEDYLMGTVFGARGGSDEEDDDAQGEERGGGEEKK